jgi:hypothetical protein
MMENIMWQRRTEMGTFHGRVLEPEIVNLGRQAYGSVSVETY